MNLACFRLPDLHPALRRLSGLVPLDPPAMAAIEAAVRQAVAVPVHRDIQSEGKGVDAARMIVQGWAARVRVQVDGRRQFLSFLLPGDLIGMSRQPDPLATSSITALTPLKICPVPSAEASTPLATAYAMSAAMEEAYLLDQIARLGRLNAQERILNLLLELNERLELAGLASNGSFEMPLTQEHVADALGLTPVHINRMVQQARREAGIVWSGKQVTIENHVRLAQRIGRTPVRVSSSQGA